MAVEDFHFVLNLLVLGDLLEFLEEICAFGDLLGLPEILELSLSLEVSVGLVDEDVGVGVLLLDVAERLLLLEFFFAVQVFLVEDVEKAELQRINGVDFVVGESVEVVLLLLVDLHVENDVHEEVVLDQEEVAVLLALRELFDDDGQNVEKVLRLEVSLSQRVHESFEDVDDFQGNRVLALLQVVNEGHYVVEFAGVFFNFLLKFELVVEYGLVGLQGEEVEEEELESEVESFFLLVEQVLFGLHQEHQLLEALEVPFIQKLLALLQLAQEALLLYFPVNHFLRHLHVFGEKHPFVPHQLGIIV